MTVFVYTLGLSTSRPWLRARTAAFRAQCATRARAEGDCTQHDRRSLAMRGTRIVLAAQIALCVALLVGAGLLVRTLQT